MDKYKNEYIEKFIPLCNELEELDRRRSLLKPYENYKDKQSYDVIQKEIEEKFKPITEKIYDPITNKLKELGIWTGDAVYTSIWNNNASEIIDFKRNFSEEDAKEVFHYKQKYLSFRTETNNNFLCLSFIFSNLDEVLKELFDFFKDTSENEFDSFETKTIKVKNFTELAKNLKANVKSNVRYSIPNETVFDRQKKEQKLAEVKNEFNVFNMGDKIEIVSISNRKGQVTVGKNNKTNVNDNDEIAKKSYSWQKRDTIIMIIIGVVGIVIAYLSLIK